MTGHRRALARALLGEALAAYGDMATAPAHHGSVATTLGVRGLTATLMVVNGLLMMRETRKVAAASGDTRLPAGISVARRRRFPLRQLTSPETLLSGPTRPESPSP